MNTLTMKKILIILFTALSFNAVASEQLLRISNNLQSAKNSIEAGLGISAQTELKSLKTQAMNLDESNLSDYQKGLKLQYIYEIDQLLTSTFETTRARFLASKISLISLGRGW